MTKPPNDLRAAGKRLWNDLGNVFVFDDSAPLVAELCRIADRLAEVRETLTKEGLIDEDGKKHPLADLEPKLSAQLQKLWKLAGFSDPEPKEKRGAGRPVGS
jgi:hypothetical protein